MQANTPFPSRTPEFKSAHAGLERLSEQQAKVMDYCMTHMLQNQCMATCADIKTAFGWSSGNAAHGMLKTLQRKGYLETIESETGSTKSKANRLRFARLSIQFIAPAA